jgi:hypothetical protein
MESTLPIDIQLKKLSDWLVSRRICDKAWHDNISKVRETIAHAINDMPEHPEIRNLLSSTNINYFNCKAILQVLLETEKDSKNLFGMYTSQRITDWRTIISMYEKDNSYLAEASQLLNQVVLYEVPGVRKQIAKLERSIADHDRKEKDTLRRESEVLAARTAECRQLGVAGENTKQEIIQLLVQLPNLYNKWLVGARPVLVDVIKKYSHFVGSHRNANTALPALKFLMAKGNVTAYEYIYGEEPLKVEEPVLLTSTPDASDDDPEGITLDLDTVGIDDDACDLAVEDIDWGDITVEDPESEMDCVAVVEDVCSEIVIEESGTTGGIATGDEAYLLLDNRRLRNVVLDELHELSAFCKMRANELSQEKSFVLNESLSSGEEETAESWIGLHVDISSLIVQLNGPGALHKLHLVKTSSTFVNRIVSELHHKLDMAKRLRLQVAEVRVKRSEALTESNALRSSCDRVVKKTSVLQGQIEADLSKRYNNRKVNIIVYLWRALV